MCYTYYRTSFSNYGSYLCYYLIFIKFKYFVGVKIKQMKLFSNIIIYSQFSQIIMKDNLKQSSCGRIVSQRKTQMSLIREYDTKTTINFDRINQLKMKYIKKQVRTPLMALNSNQSVSVSDFTNKSKQIEQNRPKNDQQILLRNQDIHEFRKKAEHTNNTINQRLNYIEDEINKWKIIKQNQIITEVQLRAKQLQKQMAIRIPQSLKIPESIKISIIQQVQPRVPTISDNLQAKLAKNASQINESNLKLLGQFKPQRKISQQFITFVNRLKDQISLDYDFTQILLSLPNKDRQAVREFVRKNHPTADKQYFSISPVEYDPLQTDIKVSYNGTVESISKKLYDFYLKIQDHYKVKLFRSFQTSTIDTLFEQIGQKHMTLGHLVSYLNMRTGKQFRNRCLVRLLRRLGVAGHIIDQRAFMRNFVRS